jgi:hypothetical protein
MGGKKRKTTKADDFENAAIFSFVSIKKGQKEEEKMYRETKNGNVITFSLGCHANNCRCFEEGNVGFPRQTSPTIPPIQ